MFLLFVGSFLKKTKSTNNTTNNIIYKESYHSTDACITLQPFICAAVHTVKYFFVNILTKIPSMLTILIFWESWKQKTASFMCALLVFGCFLIRKIRWWCCSELNKKGTEAGALWWANITSTGITGDTPVQVNNQYNHHAQREQSNLLVSVYCISLQVLLFIWYSMSCVLYLKVAPSVFLLLSKEAFLFWYLHPEAVFSNTINLIFSTLKSSI